MDTWFSESMSFANCCTLCMMVGGSIGGPIGVGGYLLSARHYRGASEGVNDGDGGWGMKVGV